MEQKNTTIVLASLFILVLTLNLASAIIVDSDFETIYPGEPGTINLDVENNENFDIEDISISLNLNDVPFTSVGSSIEDVDDLDEGDDDSVSFTIRASTDIVPGDYTLPYTIKYTNAENNSESFEKEGGFGLRVSAETDLDFTIETNEDSVLGREGQITLEIINLGLGEVKSLSVEVFPQGYELLSKEKVFVGSIDGDDSDTASFDVIYKTKNPSFSAKITYKDFDNEDQVETINLPIKVYTEEQALELGLIEGPNYTLYIILGVLVLGFIGYRIRKKRKKRSRR